MPVFLAMLVVVASALAVGAGAASAAIHRGFTAHLGAKGSGAGQLEEPQGVAVNDTTGDVYVVDRGNERVDEFEADGAFVRAWGWGVADGIAMEPQTCTITCFRGLAGSGNGQLDSPEAIAVDNSGSASDPSKEDVYVTNLGSGVIEKFGPGGEVLERIAKGSGGASFGGLLGVAVDPNGVVWVYVEKTGKPVGEEHAELDGYSDAEPNALTESHESEAEGDANPGFAVAFEGAEDNFYVGDRESHKFAKLNGDGEVIVEEVSGAGSTAVAVDSSNDAYVNVGSVVEEVSGATPPVGVETFGGLHAVSGAGVAVGSAAGPAYVADMAGDTVDVFTFGETPTEAPETMPPGDITATGAKLEGELNPGGASGRLEYEFDYNTGASCAGGQSVPVPRGEVANASKAVVSLAATGLQPNAEYTYCLVAVNPFGELQGNEVSFHTVPAPPAILSESATGVKPEEATLHATINPNNEETTYQFEYSTKATGETLEAPIIKVPGVPGTIASAFEEHAVEAATEVLAPHTTYFYRVVAENEQSKKEPQPAEGRVEQFITGPLETPEAEPASSVGPHEATLNGVLDPNSPVNFSSYEFFYSRSVSECEPGGAPEKVTAAAEAHGLEKEAVQAAVTELLPHTTYAFCLHESNEAGEAVTSAPETFTTLAVAPQVSGVAATQVTSTSAKLHAEINPGGAETTYHFEYLSDADFAANGDSWAGSHVPAVAPEAGGNAGAGITDVPVSVLIEHLAPATTYHYRLVAHSALAPPEGIPGAEHAFTTQTSTATRGLIDGREWELVSPPEKHGAPLEMSNEEAGVIQAADNGGALSYFALAPVGENEPAGNRSFAYTQLLSKRVSPGVWGTQDIATRQKNVQGLISGGVMTEYKLFSSDLSTGLVEPEGGTLLSPLATERTPYLRNDQGGEYMPLLPASGLRPGTKFGGKEQEEGGKGFEDGVEFVTATPDLSHVVFRSHLALTGAFQAGFETGPESLYEWSNGTVSLASVLPDGQPAAEASLDSLLGDSDRGVRNAVSTDGTRLVFEAENPGSGGERHLYLRDVALGETLQLDTVQEGVVNPGVEKPTFVDATADDGRVFFVDSQRLTANSRAGKNSTPGNPEADLYMCEVTVVAGGVHCALKDLSVAPAPHEGEPGSVSGVDLGIDESGTWVYFVASGVLAPGASAGQPNLYVEDTDTGSTRLVATLSGEDAPDWRAGIESGSLDKFSELTSRVSGDGRFVAFMSDVSLTGYDNRDARSGIPDEEVFLYDRVTGLLRCVSCDPSGARPVGVLDPGSEEAAALRGELPLLVDRPGVWGGRWLAGSLPGWPLVDNFHALYEPRNLSNSGRVFFDSAGGLVGGDGNGKEDVYEFEPSGVGGCGLVAGCVGLISSGASGEESAFMDASGVGPGGEEGEDVFFMSASRLVGKDVDRAMDVYDAHVCSVVGPCVSGGAVVLPACDTADSCRAAPVAQPDIFGAPASATFSGPGNPPPAPPVRGRSAAQVRAEKLARALTACHRKKNKHRRVACEKHAHHVYGAVRKASARKASVRKAGARRAGVGDVRGGWRVG